MGHVLLEWCCFRVRAMFCFSTPLLKNRSVDLFGTMEAVTIEAEMLLSGDVSGTPGTSSPSIIVLKSCKSKWCWFFLCSTVFHLAIFSFGYLRPVWISFKRLSL